MGPRVRRRGESEWEGKVRGEEGGTESEGEGRGKSEGEGRVRRRGE